YDVPDHSTPCRLRTDQAWSIAPAARRSTWRLGAREPRENRRGKARFRWPRTGEALLIPAGDRCYPRYVGWVGSGAAQVGMPRALLERGIDADLVVGASVGEPSEDRHELVSGRRFGPRSPRPSCAGRVTYSSLRSLLAPLAHVPKLMIRCL